MYLLIDGRRLDPGNMFIPVKEGSELAIECISEGGNPPPTLTWKIKLSRTELDQYTKTLENVTVKYPSNPRKTTAHLKVLREHNNATITCLVEHVALFSSLASSILLDVQCKANPITKKKSQQSLDITQIINILLNLSSKIIR